MKLSKSLLATIAVGLSLGTTTSSCTSGFLISDLEEGDERVSNDEETFEPNWGECLDCGMG